MFVIRDPATARGSRPFLLQTTLSLHLDRIHPHKLRESTSSRSVRLSASVVREEDAKNVRICDDGDTQSSPLVSVDIQKDRLTLPVDVSMDAFAFDVSVSFSSRERKRKRNTSLPDVDSNVPHTQKTPTRTDSISRPFHEIWCVVRIDS